LLRNIIEQIFCWAKRGKREIGGKGLEGSVGVAENGGLEERHGRILFFPLCERGCFILQRKDGFRASSGGDQEGGGLGLPGYKHGKASLTGNTGRYEPSRAWYYFRHLLYEVKGEI
jgi:hypothetical protein